MNLLILSAILLFATTALLCSTILRKYLAERNAVGRLGCEARLGLLDNLSGRIANKNKAPADGELVEIFNQLGWRGSRKRTIFFIVQITLPIVLTLIVVLVQSFQDKSTDSSLSMLMPLFALGIGYLLPKRVVGKWAKTRKERLAVEVSTMIPLLRMLFEVGMTVEQALRVLVATAGKILPELVQELEYILQRVDAGLELGQELRHTAFLMKIDELTDSFTILEQLLYQGGGGMSSLLSLKELMDKRRMTTLQEKVSKMSAKMSAVMMVFLFPALLIVLAGPGFIAIIQALGDMR